MNRKISIVLPHIVAVVVFVILNCIYFYPQLQGKVVQAGDIISNIGMKKELLDERKETGENVMWTNSMFGGMPAFLVSTPRNSNKVKWIKSGLHVFFNSPIGVFNSLMIGFYILLIVLKVDPWLSIIGAVGFGFGTNHLILLEAGHNTKLQTLAFLPIVFSGLLLTFNKRLLLGGILFTLGMALSLDANHPQMVYYFGLTLLIYVVISGIDFVRKREIVALGKIGGTLMIGLILAFMTSSALLLSTYEHTSQTMRGDPILDKSSETEATSSSQVDGLEWNYAMNWSNAAKDLITSFIPGAVGGASARKINQKSAFAKEVRKSGNRAELAPLYWGGLPSTAGPIYFGSVTMLLFVLGLIMVKGQIKWWTLGSIILIAMISLGSNLEWFNRLLFDHFPLFNKFRAHSSAMAITGLLIPMLGFLGFQKILREDISKKLENKIKVAGLGFLILILFFAVAGVALFDFTGANDSTYQQQNGWVEALIADRKSLLRMDAFRSCLFAGAAFGIIWLYLKKKIGQTVLITVIGLLILVDMWGVGKRYLDSDSFVTSRLYENNYSPRPVNEQIFANEPKGRGYYRVLDLSQNTFNSSKTSYFHNTIGGYHPAKLQRYQDIIDYHLSKGNFSVLNMLNTKYIIDQEAKVQQNNGALGTAWFVESIEQVETPNREIEVLSSLDPKNTAIVLRPEFGDYLDGFDPDRTGSIELVDYQPHHLKYQSNSLTEQFAVFSEIWYGPDKGWETYIDGEPAEHIRANYILRAMKVPAGQHEIEFIFSPKLFTTGTKISFISSLFLLGFAGFYFGKQGYEFFQKEDEKPKEKKAVAKKKIRPKTRSKKK